jgi:hypothetical protein
MAEKDTYALCLEAPGVFVHASLGLQGILLEFGDFGVLISRGSQTSGLSLAFRFLMMLLADTCSFSVWLREQSQQTELDVEESSSYEYSNEQV